MDERWIARVVGGVLDEKMFPEASPGCGGPAKPINAQPPNNMGNRVVISPGQARGEASAVGVFKVSGTDLNADVLTVSLGVTYPVSLIDGDFTFMKLNGKVSWGQGGSRFTAYFDWNRGTQISLIGSAAEVAFFFETGEEGVPIGAPDFDIEVSAGLVEGSRAGRANPRRTTNIVNIEPEGAAVFPIPPFAYGAIPQVADASWYDSAASRFQFLGGIDPASLISERFADRLPLNLEGQAFPEQARFVRLTNALETPIEACVTFPLNL